MQSSTLRSCQIVSHRITELTHRCDFLQRRGNTERHENRQNMLKEREEKKKKAKTSSLVASSADSLFLLLLLLVTQDEKRGRRRIEKRKMAVERKMRRNNIAASRCVFLIVERDFFFSFSTGEDKEEKRKQSEETRKREEESRTKEEKMRRRRRRGGQRTEENKYTDRHIFGGTCWSSVKHRYGPKCRLIRYRSLFTGSLGFYSTLSRGCLIMSRWVNRSCNQHRIFILVNIDSFAYIKNFLLFRNSLLK